MKLFSLLFIVGSIVGYSPCDFEAYRMRYGNKCKSKSDQMKNTNPRILDLIAASNTMLDV